MRLGSKNFFAAAHFSQREAGQFGVSPQPGTTAVPAAELNRSAGVAAPRKSLKQPIPTDSTDGHRERTCPKSVLPTDSDVRRAGVTSRYEQRGHGRILQGSPRGASETVSGLRADAGDLPAGGRTGELGVAAARSAGSLSPARCPASASDLPFVPAANLAAPTRTGTDPDIVGQSRSPTAPADPDLLRANHLAGRE